MYMLYTLEYGERDRRAIAQIFAKTIDKRCGGNCLAYKKNMLTLRKVSASLSGTKSTHAHITEILISFFYERNFFFSACMALVIKYGFF